MAGKTKAELDVLFEDNASKNIVASRLRDFVDSAQAAIGSYYISTAIETVISTQSTWTKALGTTTASALNLEFTHADNRLTYTGTPTVTGVVSVSLSMTSAASNVVLGLAMLKNGSVVTSSIIQRKVGTGADVGAAALSALVSLDTNDYIELAVSNEDGTGNVTVEYACVIVNCRLT